jgi:UDP-glucose 4-epimerase
MAEPGYHVIGLDMNPPEDAIKELDFVQADIRNPLLADLFKAEEVDVVCHLAFVETTRRSESAFDINVMGSMKVLGACADAGVGKVVLRSSTSVYGARPSNSAFLTEDHPLHGSRRYGYTRDMVEIEAFCNGFRRQVPGMAVTVLRFPSIVGPTVDTPMTRFLREPWAPSLLGFDPMMQLIHEDDVVEALAYAVLHGASGTFNVAAEDVLPFNKIRGLAGKLPLPVLHPLAYWGVRLLRGTGLRFTRYMPIELDYIRYPWVGDLKRMHEELGFEPRHTAEEALGEFAQRHRMRRHLRDSAATARGEEQMRELIEQRRRTRERQAGSGSAEKEG